MNDIDNNNNNKVKMHVFGSVEMLKRTTEKGRVEGKVKWKRGGG